MSYFLMYEIGECNDSLRDRSFIRVEAASEAEALEKILAHYLELGYDGGTLWDIDTVRESWGIFCSSAMPITVWASDPVVWEVK